MVNFTAQVYLMVSRDMELGSDCPLLKWWVRLLLIYGMNYILEAKTDPFRIPAGTSFFFFFASSLKKV